MREKKNSNNSVLCLDVEIMNTVPHTCHPPLFEKCWNMTFIHPTYITNASVSTILKPCRPQLSPVPFSRSQLIQEVPLR